MILTAVLGVRAPRTTIPKRDWPEPSVLLAECELDGIPAAVRAASRTEHRAAPAAPWPVLELLERHRRAIAGGWSASSYLALADGLERCRPPRRRAAARFRRFASGLEVAL